ncbi:hypothetical protein BDB00DRAFT_829639 [Zychaea mexicana]|uniref:uncharacterized protein n=1 Tax=Zychaea mexicana TaxID=64656 RepID=UPI0022FF2B27|nr:uncharacterized protein BDB00DRAFT_829639 [Zychaea mexicana]KAI9492198.1 hypothetical protein BDB00DRAFT_829639 [Zychaea mexicana]
MSDQVESAAATCTAPADNTTNNNNNSKLDGNGQETLEAMQERHGAEQKALQAKIIALRKSVPSSNKRKKKEVQSRINDMEYDLRVKHEKELRALQGEEEEDEDDGISLERLQELSVQDGNNGKDATDETSKKAGAIEQQQKKKKPNKAKLRQQRREAEMQRLRDEAEKEASDQVDMGALEKASIQELLEKLKLKVHEIHADGHCLYNAISNQLSSRYHQEVGHQELRKLAASYMRDHSDDFIPFLYKDDGDMYSADDFERYCDEIEKTPRWGGQIEIVALSRVKEVPIHIVQMGQPVLKVNEEEYPGKAPLKLAYHKHLYSLGAHYNSLLDA